MKKSKRKKPVRFWKLKFWERRLRKIKKVVYFKKMPGFRARILAVSAVSFLALAAIIYYEYSFWSKIKMPEEGRGYFFSEDNFRKMDDSLKRVALYDIKIAIVADAHVGIE